MFSSLYLSVIFSRRVFCLNMGFVLGLDDSIQIVNYNLSEIVGNMDGSLDAGESDLIEIKLGIGLGYEASVIDGTLYTNRSDVFIKDGYAFWGNIKNGSTSYSLPNHITIRFLPENREPILTFYFVIRWMDPKSNWNNTTIDFSMQVNHGFNVTINTNGLYHDVTQPLIFEAKPVGKLDREPVLGANIAMSIIHPDRTERRTDSVDG